MATYREAGVDVEAGERLVSAIGPTVRTTWNDDVVGGFGGFAGGVRIPAGYRRPVVMMTTDGVGTKLEVARRTGRLDGVGFDLVAMCVDDLAAVGARPIGFTDYLAVGRLDPGREARIVASVAAACRTAECPLLGGETAEHPGVMEPDQIDVSGTAIGVVEEDAVISGSEIRAGDIVVAVASPNLRSNGYSLVRQVFDLERLDESLPGTGGTLGEVLTEPSVIYAPAVLDAVASGGIRGLAHVTGGGIPGNLVRVLPDGLAAEIDTSTWQPPAVFSAIAARGGIDAAEMFRTFNMGVGYLAVVDPNEVDALVGGFAGHGHAAWPAGRILRGDPGVRLV